MNLCSFNLRTLNHVACPIATRIVSDKT